MKAFLAIRGLTPRPKAWAGLAALPLSIASLLMAGTAAGAQEKAPPPPMPTVGGPAAKMGGAGNSSIPADELLRVPVVNLQIGGVKKVPSIKNPMRDDPQARQRGMQYFIQFNCVGCHMSNGGGGMGPALSNAKFIYGSEPENIYLTILQGRPNGMPSWGGRLPDNVIWDLVAYVRGISKVPGAPWGITISAEHPKIEQVPAEYLKTADPWNYTEPFSYGQKPFEKLKGKAPAPADKQ